MGLVMNYQAISIHLNEWLDKLRLEEKSENTIRQYKNSIETLIHFINERHLEEINKKEILLFKSFLKESGLYKERTIRNKLIAVNKYLKYLNLDNAKVKVERVSSNNYRDCLTENDYKNLLKYTLNRNTKNAYRDYLMMRTLAETGIRVSELKYFTVPALKSMECNKLKVTNKGKTRFIFIPDTLKDDLLKYADKNNIENIIFHGNRQIKENGTRLLIPDDNKLLDTSTIWRNFQKLAIKADINPELVNPHSFRHRFALEYLTHNGNNQQALINLRRILGHSDFNTTLIYLNVSDEELAKSVNGIHG